MSTQALSALLEAACAEADPPAAACVALEAGRVVHASAHGSSPDGHPTELDSVFDVASVTKIVATTSAIARLVAAGAFALDTAVVSLLPEFPHPEITVRAVLGHRSGLAAWHPFFVDAMEDPLAGSVFDRTQRQSPEALRAAFDRGRERVLRGVFERPLERPGRRVYSDLGFLTLGAVVERVTGQRLDAYCREVLHADRELGFVDLARPDPWIGGRHVLPTGHTRPREPAPGQEQLYRVPAQRPAPDAGRVDDDNAFAMGGVAGHAGVFATAPALAAYGAALIEELDGADALGIGPDVMRELVAIDPAEGPARALGFDVPTGPRSTAGSLGRGPRGAIGHLGFTGCSLWMDLDRRLSVALVTNRTLPGRAQLAGIRALRPAVHDALVFGGPQGLSGT